MASVVLDNLAAGTSPRKFCSIIQALPSPTCRRASLTRPKRSTARMSEGIVRHDGSTELAEGVRTYGRRITAN